MVESQLSCDSINLDELSKGIPVISPRSSGYFVEACMVCLHSQGHESGVELSVKTDSKEYCFNINWKYPVTEQLLRNFGGNNNKTTENGATAIALILIRELTEYDAVQEPSVSIISETLKA